MRKKLAAGNWKMNLDYENASTLAKALKAHSIAEGTEVIIAVPHVYLQSIAEICKDNSDLTVAAQNCHEKEKGAFTGEISIAMLASIGVDHVIVGHSERRQYFHESDELLKEKVDALLAHAMTPIFCFGEPLEKRESEDHFTYVLAQLENSIFHLSADDLQKLILAYEPIWAIGTGKTASPEQAQEMHAFIRSQIAERYNASVAKNMTILYGGSVKPANAKELFANDDVDGGLVGGASLKADSFTAIIDSF